MSDSHQPFVRRGRFAPPTRWSPGVHVRYASNRGVGVILVGAFWLVMAAFPDGAALADDTQFIWVEGFGGTSYVHLGNLGAGDDEDLPAVEHRTGWGVVGGLAAGVNLASFRIGARASRAEYDELSLTNFLAEISLRPSMAWARACSRLCRERGVIVTLRYAPEPGRGAVLAREEPGGSYVVVSALGLSPDWQNGSVVGERQVQRARPLR